MALSVFSDDKQVVIVMPKRAAINLGVVLDACGDTIGNIEAAEVELTTKQLTQAEDDILQLSAKLMAM